LLRTFRKTVANKLLLLSFEKLIYENKLTIDHVKYVFACIHLQTLFKYENELVRKATEYLKYGSFSKIIPPFDLSEVDFNDGWFCTLKEKVGFLTRDTINESLIVNNCYVSRGKSQFKNLVKNYAKKFVLYTSFHR
jgi:hypothetical protein